MSLKFADRLQWAKEQFEREILLLDVAVQDCYGFYKERRPHQDDEDDCLNAARELLRFAHEQVEEARRVLEEGV